MNSTLRAAVDSPARLCWQAVKGRQQGGLSPCTIIRLFYQRRFLEKFISTQHLLVMIGFCLALSSAAEPYFQGFCGIDVFIWERLNSSIYAEMV